MIINLQQISALLPMLIVVLTVVAVMLTVAWRRNHLLNSTLSVLGLNAALFSLWFVGQAGAIDITPLIRVDGYAMLYTGLVLLVSLATCTFAYPWLEGYKDHKEEFYLLVLIAALGGIILSTANHLATLFLGIELFSLPLFGLVGYSFHQQRSLEASIKYTLLSAVSSSFLLFGMALLYAQIGNLSFLALSKSFSDNMYQPLLMAGFGLMIVGLSFKLSLVPFHLWTPDVYQGAPAPVAIFLATASKIAIFCLLMRLFLYAPIGNSKAVHVVLGFIAFASIIVGNLVAMMSQNNIKRLLGYSSISHMGYLLVAAMTTLQSSQMSMETVGVYLVSYLFSNLGAFGVVSLMSSPYRGQDADSLFLYRGLFWHRPILSAALTVMMLSLAGIPLTLGFIGKFYVLYLGVQAQLWWLTTAVVVGSAIGLYYYLRVAVSLYLSSPRPRYRDNKKRNWQYNAGEIVVLISAILVLILGVYPQPLINIVQHAIPIL